MRRSSLKFNDNTKGDPKTLLQKKVKRNSVSWGNSNTFQFKSMKTMFQETKDFKKSSKETEKKHKDFIENRKKSIKNEFLIVKELMKKKMVEENEDELDDEVTKNTKKNIKIGHDGLNLKEESDSCPSMSEESS